MKFLASIQTYNQAIMITPEQYASLERRIIASVDDRAEELIAISRDIHAHPELMWNEHYAVKTLTAALTADGFEVEHNTGGLDTAFMARTHGTEPNGPMIGIIAEYDALPEIGHACGHNLIATSALGAGFALNSVMSELPGTVAVIGTPAEEGGGGKMIMRDKGVFKGVDAVMMTHMAMENVTKPVFLAVGAVEIVMHGRASHAAAAPEAGINALDAIIQTFNGINALRQHIRSDSRIHGVITNGGAAANIVPELAVASFACRALDAPYADLLVKKLRLVAEGAALATGATLEFKHRISVEHVQSNDVMARLFGNRLKQFGRESAERQKDGPASTDMGPLSHHVPAIHPLVQIVDLPTAWHTPDFRDAAYSDRGQQGMLVAAKAMALTTLDLLVKPGLLDTVKAEFEAYIKATKLV